MEAQLGKCSRKMGTQEVVRSPRDKGLQPLSWASTVVGRTQPQGTFTSSLVRVPRRIEKRVR